MGTQKKGKGRSARSTGAPRSLRKGRTQRLGRTKQFVRAVVAIALCGSSDGFVR